MLQRSRFSFLWADVGQTSCSQGNNWGLSVTPEAQWHTFPLQITTTCCQQTTKHPPIPAALHTHAHRHACSTSNHQLLKKRPLCLSNCRSVCSLIMMLHQLGIYKFSMTHFELDKALSKLESRLSAQHFCACSI